MVNNNGWNLNESPIYGKVITHLLTSWDIQAETIFQWLVQMLVHKPVGFFHPKKYIKNPFIMAIYRGYLEDPSI